MRLILFEKSNSEVNARAPASSKMPHWHTQQWFKPRQQNETCIRMPATTVRYQPIILREGKVTRHAIG